MSSSLVFESDHLQDTNLPNTNTNTNTEMSVSDNQTNEQKTTQKTLGVVKWFDSRGGFGFITILPGETHAGKDIFVHYSSLAVAQTQYKYLVLGEYVEFVMSSSDNEKYEFSAKEVSGIRGGNLMCESRRLSALEARPDEQCAAAAASVATTTPAVSRGEKHYRNHDANLVGAPGRRLPAAAAGRGGRGGGYRAAPPQGDGGGDFIPVTTRKRNRRVSEPMAMV
jgi:cold shock CspA family protein